MNHFSFKPLMPKSKVVILWSAPRCVSTAFERTFAQRADTFIWHEPFAQAYYFGPWRQSNRSGNFSAEDMNYKERGDPGKVLQAVCEKEAPLIFIKDMAYHFLPYMNKDFLASVTNTFIIRDPQETIASWYKINEKPTEAEFGFEALHKLWAIVTEEMDHQPIVVSANEFRCDPTKTLKSYCQAISVDFDPYMVNWDSGREQKQWKPGYERAHRRKWFSAVDSSSRILPPTPVHTPCLPDDQTMVDRAKDMYADLLKYAIA